MSTTTAPPKVDPADASVPEPQDGRDFIRPIESRDRTAVEQLVGQGYMEDLAIANRKCESA